MTHAPTPTFPVFFPMNVCAFCSCSVIAQPSWMEADGGLDGEGRGGVVDGDDEDGKKTAVPSFVSKF